MGRLIENGISRTNLVGSVLRKKGEKEEIEKTLEENGTITEYLKDLKKNPPERYKEDELKIDFYNAFR